jgi:hypothetical protein
MKEQQTAHHAVSEEIQGWLADLKKARPDLFAKVNAGRLTVKTAARLAGIIQVSAALERAQKAYQKLSGMERQQFHEWYRSERMAFLSDQADARWRRGGGSARND